MADYISALNGQQMDAALTEVALYNPEAWAVGQRNGVPVTSADETWHNNAKYYAQVAQSAIPGTYTAAVRWDIAQGLAGEAQEQARANISAGASNRNLLDNPWFTVNQREYTSKKLLQLQYWADRWLQNTSISGQGYLSLSNGIVTLTAPSGSGRFGNIIQNMADPSIISGKVVTLSLLKSDGTIIGGSFTRVAGTSQFAYNQNNIKLQIAPNNTIVVEVQNGASISFKAVKLELGSYSTLANDVPPDYAGELTKCRYYFRRISNTSGYTQLWLLGRNRSTTGADFYGVLGNQPMRTAPTISRSGSIYVQNADTNIAITDLTRYFTVSSDFVLRATVASGLTANAPCALALGSGAYIDLSADL